MKRLEERDLIFVTEDPKDSRKKLIFLTRAGKQALDKATESVRCLSSELGDIEQSFATLRLTRHSGAQPFEPLHLANVEK
jgi:DNA-binding MarR family transcriptional regulator